VTPPLTDGLLPGCERAALVADGTLEEASFGIEDLEGAASVAWKVKVAELELVGSAGCVSMAVFGAVWIFVGAFQIVVTDASEVMNVVTYGGNYMTSYPLALYGRNLMLFLTFGVPMAFVNWQPTLSVLGHPDPLGLPEAFRFAGPVFAAALWCLALVAWRAALRRHRSTGS